MTNNLGNDIIICNDVHKWFGDFHVLKGITTSVKEGEVVVVIGPSGSGRFDWSCGSGNADA